MEWCKVESRHGVNVVAIPSQPATWLLTLIWLYVSTARLNHTSLLSPRASCDFLNSRHPADCILPILAHWLAVGWIPAKAIHKRRLCPHGVFLSLWITSTARWRVYSCVLLCFINYWGINERSRGFFKSEPREHVPTIENHWRTTSPWPPLDNLREVRILTLHLNYVAGGELIPSSSSSNGPSN